MEIVRNTQRWGNSAGVLLPREWLGSQVKIILVNRTNEIKKETLAILEPYLGQIMGVYLVGSYARGEQTDDSDIDILAISKTIKKEIISGKYHVSIAPFSSISSTLGRNPLLVLPRLKEAKALLNVSLLEELSQTKISKSSFKQFIQECRGILKINKEFLKIDKESSDFLDSKSVVYSLFLRLRGIFIMNCLLNQKRYFNKEFARFLSNKLDKDEIKETYSVYRAVRDNKKNNIRIKIKTAEKLFLLLKREIDIYDK